MMLPAKQALHMNPKKNSASGFDIQRKVRVGIVGPLLEYEFKKHD